MKTDLPIPQMIFGTIAMLVITAMIYDFVDPNQCAPVTNLEDKQKCQELTDLIFNSIPIAWGLYIGGGITLYLLMKYFKAKELKNDTK